MGASTRIIKISRPLLTALVILAVAGRAWALGKDPKANLGTFRDGNLLKVDDILRGHKDFALAVLDASADLQDARLQDVSFAGADLAGVDLTGADLTGADLKGTDFTGAILRNAIFTGAKLAGANFTDADLTGATFPAFSELPADVLIGGTRGPDGILMPARAHGASSFPSGTTLRAPTWLPKPSVQRAAGHGSTIYFDSDLRPFFMKGKPFGSIQILAISDTDLGVRKLAAWPDGLAWLTANPNEIYCITPRNFLGWRTDNHILNFWILKDTLWCLDDSYKMDGCLVKHLLNYKSNPKSNYVWVIPNDMSKTPDSFAFSDSTLYCTPTRGNAIICIPMTTLKTASMKSPNRETTIRTISIPQSTFAPHDSVDHYSITATFDDLIAIKSKNQHGGLLPITGNSSSRKIFTYYNGGLEPGSTVLTHSGYLATLLQGGMLMSMINLSNNLGVVHGPFNKPRLRIGDVAEGPSGTLWYTEPLNNAICTLDPATGKVQRFQMPEPGLFPEQIINGGNGLMYFTLRNKGRIGAIVARVPGASDPQVKSSKDSHAPENVSSSSSSKDEAPRLTRKQRQQLKEKERKQLQRKAQQEKAAAALARFKAEAQAQEGPAASPLTTPTQFHQNIASSKEEQVQAPPGPLEVANAHEARPDDAPGAAFASMPADIDHIFDTHHFGAQNEKGQFLEEDTPGSIQRLIDTALQKRVTPLVISLKGRWETDYPFPYPIGFYLDKDKWIWVPTHVLRVVLSGAQDWVISAYPVQSCLF